MDDLKLVSAIDTILACDLNKGYGMRPERERTFKIDLKMLRNVVSNNYAMKQFEENYKKYKQEDKAEKKPLAKKPVKRLTKSVVEPLQASNG